MVIKYDVSKTTKNKGKNEGQNFNESTYYSTAISCY